jgi:hypothetical protein
MPTMVSALLLEDAPRFFFLVAPLAFLVGCVAVREMREGAIRRWKQGWGGRLALMSLFVLMVLVPLSVWLFDPRAAG